jgi:hypothetical protein
MNRFALLLFAFPVCLSGQIASNDFVLDQSKPWVYVKFDHIGPRKPAAADEGTTGLWLRIVNNCRIPIKVRASGPPEGDPGTAVEDEVVPAEPMLQIFSSGGEGDRIRREEEEKEKALKRKPNGYGFEVSGVATIQPGKELLVSFPREHVSEWWYLRVRVALAVSPQAASLGPFTYLEFRNWDVPKR